MSVTLSPAGSKLSQILPHKFRKQLHDDSHKLQELHYKCSLGLQCSFTILTIMNIKINVFHIGKSKTKCSHFAC